jgi:hypothetical protein
MDGQHCEGMCQCQSSTLVFSHEFRRYQPACEFEKLREHFGGDEKLAWAEYQKLTARGNTFVVDPSQYEEGALYSKNNRPPLPPPGHGWTSKVVKEAKQNRTHWRCGARQCGTKLLKK